MSVNVPRRLSSLGCMNALASWAEQLAQALLQVPLPRRWAHVQGIAARARSLAPVLSADADLMEAAAWLHDIGYASDLATTGMPRTRRRRTSATFKTPTPCSADWSRITPAPASRPRNAGLATS